MRPFIFENYPNLLNHVSLSAPQIEGQIAAYELVFLPTRNAEVEWKIAFPTFLKPFYKYVWQQNQIPTQQDYWQYYVAENDAFFESTAFADDILRGLQARVFRTYPSLVRDIHFVFYLQTQLPQAQVLYNTQLDVKEGIDVLVVHDEQFWAFNLYTPTRRAQESRAKKQHRHHLFDNVNYHELPVIFDKQHQIGAFFLYGERELMQIKKWIGCA